MSYKVINRFMEKEHDNHIYEVGDTYPVEGKKLVKTRAEFLCKEHPTFKKPFLEENKAKNQTKSTKNESKEPEKSDE